MRLRKDLYAKSFIKLIYDFFCQIQDPTNFKRNSNINLSDCLMSCFALFSLKWPSLLQYDRKRLDPIVKDNLKSLFHVQYPPSDTYMRERLDLLDYSTIRPAFKKIFASLQRSKILEKFQFINNSYLVSIDGTGHFNSDKIYCENCCVKNHYNGTKTYHHNLLGAAIVKPGVKQVLPLCPEPIKNQDGDTKNDCEQKATKRLLNDLKREHPHLKLIILQDALADNGPNILNLQRLSFQYIIVSKRRLNLLDKYQNKICNTAIIDEHGTQHIFRYINDVDFKSKEGSFKSNYVEWNSIDKKGKEQKNSWITNINVTDKNVYKIMQGGRARWKIENETFNTLKNQGYNFEHNFGHGNINLCTVMSYLMLLAFLIDQAQNFACKIFQKAKEKAGTFSELWEYMRSYFRLISITTWDVMFGLINCNIRLNTS
jgi:hypothetical protein